MRMGTLGFQKPFQVLHTSDQQGFNIDAPQTPQPKSRQSVPLFGLTEQGFNPDGAFPQRFCKISLLPQLFSPIQFLLEIRSADPTTLTLGSRTVFSNRTRTSIQNTRLIDDGLMIAIERTAL